MTAVGTGRKSVSITHRSTPSGYTDSYVVQVPGASARPAIDWMRQLLEQSPVYLRSTLPVGWRLLGLRHESRYQPGAVLGWPVVAEQPDEVVLGAPSRLGLDARLTLAVQDDALRFATAIRFEHRVARTLWAGIAPAHRATVAHLARRATV